MVFEIAATIYGLDNFHSSKTNKDYNKIGLIIDGKARYHFIDDADVSKVLNSEPIKKYRSSGNQPLLAKCVFDIKCTEKGWSGYLRDIKNV